MESDEPLIFAGSGPGAQTSDGSSVELLRRIGYLGELEPVRQFLLAGSTVLELGCGAGRQTRQLLEWGLLPWSVDQCREMLAHLPAGARAIHSTIQSLALRDRFPVVLLGSGLVNHLPRNIRASMLAAAVRHLRPDGWLLLERHDPHWLRTAKTGYLAQRGNTRIHVDAIDRAGLSVRLRLRYQIGDNEWLHEVTIEALEEVEIEELLNAEGLKRISWHGPEHLWAVASFA